MLIGGVFSGMNISASGMSAERLRMDIISLNIANINTTRTPEGGPYRRKVPIFAPRAPQPLFNIPFVRLPVSVTPGDGVRVLRIEEDATPPKLKYEPGHPDADKDGYVAYPNINLATEMINLITATRAYEANVTAVRAAKQMMTKALEI
ncbi:TPA: flagellar basal body rod protein FlgC [bacterium]|nr:flagellar basal body rod protein FlgC [bacterium]